MGKERKLKNACGYKMLSQNHSARDKNVTEKPGEKKSKIEQPKVARVEFRAGEWLHGPEKPGWSDTGIEKVWKRKKPPVSIKSQQVPLLGVLLSLQKSCKNRKWNSITK